MVLFGSGNVGTHLAQVMMGSGVEIRQIYSRNPENARNLASKKEVSAIRHRLMGGEGYRRGIHFAVSSRGP